MDFLLVLLIFALMVSLFFILRRFIRPVNLNVNLYTDEKPMVDPVSQAERHKWKKGQVKKAGELKVLAEEFGDEN